MLLGGLGKAICTGIVVNDGKEGPKKRQEEKAFDSSREDIGICASVAVRVEGPVDFHSGGGAHDQGIENGPCILGSNVVGPAYSQVQHHAELGNQR